MTHLDNDYNINIISMMQNRAASPRTIDGRRSENGEQLLNVLITTPVTDTRESNTTREGKRNTNYNL